MIMRIFPEFSFTAILVFCVFFIFSILFSVPESTDAFQTELSENSITITADSQLNYSNYCFENQDYIAAASEYKKFIYFFPDDDRVDIAAYKIGMSYFYDKFYIKALNQFTRILDQRKRKNSRVLS